MRQNDLRNAIIASCSGVVQAAASAAAGESRVGRRMLGCLPVRWRCREWQPKCVLAAAQALAHG